VALELKVVRRAPSGVEQIDFEVATQIIAPGRPAATTASEKVAEQTAAEDVAEGVEDVVDIGELVKAGPREPLVTVTVVSVPFFLVPQDLEGLGGLLEPRLGLGVAGIAIGMVGQRELSVGLGDLFHRGIAGYAEHLVIIAFTCH
jgi:hypothetical protein